MALVTFVNDSAPYLNAENLNNNFNELGNDSDWITLIQGSSDNNSVHYRKIGRLVIITGVYYSSTGINIASWNAQNVATLSNEFKPNKIISAPVIAKDDNNNMLNVGIRITTNGQVDIVPWVAGNMVVNNLYVNLSYFVD